MIQPGPVELKDQIPANAQRDMPEARVGGRQPLPPTLESIDRPKSSPTPNRALSAAAPREFSSGLQKAVNVARMAIPIVQSLLPLLDGNLATAVANLIAPRAHRPAVAPPAEADLAPLEDGLAKLEAEHRSLHLHVMEQGATLKRVEDRLEMVREATNRNTREQQELLEDLRSFSKKVKIVALVGIGLLAVGFLAELAMYLHLKRLLPLW
jgi:hypothetical protein